MLWPIASARLTVAYAHGRWTSVRLKSSAYGWSYVASIITERSSVGMSSSRRLAYSSAPMMLIVTMESTPPKLVLVCRSDGVRE